MTKDSFLDRLTRIKFHPYPCSAPYCKSKAGPGTTGTSPPKGTEGTKVKTAFLYSDKFSAFTYGADHPMRPLRLKKTFELADRLGLFGNEDSAVIEARAATEYELGLFHTTEYIAALKKADSGDVSELGPDAISFSLGAGDNPTFPGVFEWSSYSAGASVQAAELILSGEIDRAFNIAGGLHHAMASRAAGFCYFNDAAIAIKKLVKQGMRVAYVDIDAHHGDGVEAAFYDTDKALTISIHEDGRYLFPGTGFPGDMGKDKGLGYAVNLPLPPGTGDALFTLGFDEVVVPFIEAYKPDVLVTQLGVDTFKADPITHLQLTTNGFEHMLKRFASFNLPWIALGGGGYDLDNVARGWTLAWAIMNNDDTSELGELKDPPSEADETPEMKKLVEDNIRYLKKEVLPLVRGG